MFNCEKADSDDVIAMFKTTSIEELKTIKPFWAFGSFSKFMRDSALKPSSNEFKVIQATTTKVILKGDFDNIDLGRLFNGEKLNDHRVARILCRWSNGQFVDPPSVSLTSGRNKILGFYDGRHRTKVAFILGLETIPLAVHRSDLTSVKALLNI